MIQMPGVIVLALRLVRKVLALRLVRKVPFWETLPEPKTLELSCAGILNEQFLKMIKLLFRECLGRFLLFYNSFKSTTFFVNKAWVPQVVLEIGWFAMIFQHVSRACPAQLQ